MTFSSKRPIGDPNIVDVVTQSDRSVILQPRNLGATNIIFLDETSVAISNVGMLVYKAIASRIDYQDVNKIRRRQHRERPLRRLTAQISAETVAKTCWALRSMGAIRSPQRPSARGYS
jgi:Flp pilus assembly secretin CpaC